MSDKAKIVYCGNGKKMKDSWLKVTLKPEILSQHIKEYNGNKYIPININILDKPNKFGKDVAVSIDFYTGKESDKDDDNYIPRDQNVTNFIPDQNVDAAGKNTDKPDDSDLPF